MTFLVQSQRTILQAVACFAVVAAAMCATASPPTGKLPGAAIPTRYTLDLVVDPSRDTFTGRVSIALNLAGPVSRFYLHGRDLKVSRAVIEIDGLRYSLHYAQVSEDGVAEVSAEQTLPSGAAELTIDYQAPFNEQLAGLYRVRAGNDDYAFTQLEAIDARRMFPGFDEPRFKTPFAISVTAPSGLVVLGNSAIAATHQADGGGQRVEFAPTPPLPTYLIAIAVGPFDVVEGQTLPPTAIRSRPVPLRGVTVRGKGHLLRYALSITQPIVETLETQLATPYPFSKLDLVAVPDFAAGAMENVGLITYRDSLLLADDDAPESQLRDIASVHAHELAHQWAGNLVTMPWWDDIWLNESFATWMEVKGVMPWKSEYGFDRMLLRSVHGAMDQDSMASARRIREPVYSSDDIANVFDEITYAKGAGVLAMFEAYVGEPRFSEGVSQYLGSRAWGSGTADDLMAALAEVSKDPGLPRAMSGFLDQAGVPIIKVDVSCADGKTNLALTQARYLPLGSQAAPNQRWQIPVCVRGATVEKTCTLLREHEADLQLPNCEPFVLPNAGGTGYYRFALDSAARGALLDALSSLSAVEQMAVADSLIAEMNQGQMTFAEFVEVAERLAGSQIREVVTAPIRVWRKLHRQILNEQQRVASRAEIRRIYGARLARVEQTDGEGLLLAAELQRFLALEGDDAKLREQLALATDTFLAKPGNGEFVAAALPADVIGTALIVYVQDGGAPAFDRVLDKLSHSDHAQYRTLLVSALGRARHEKLLDRARALLLQPSLRRNDVPRLAWSLFGDERLPRSWQWLTQNLDALLAVAPRDFQMEVPYYLSDFCSRERAVAVNDFFAPRVANLEGAPRALAQTLERIQLCAALKDRIAPD